MRKVSACNFKGVNRVLRGEVVSEVVCLPERVEIIFGSGKRLSVEADTLTTHLFNV
jgi:hypothetical protein